jgi:hypothetical protein
MANFSNDFILGALIGYFLQNYFIIFILGLACGAFIVERYGSFGSVFKWLLSHSTDNVRDIFKTYFTKKQETLLRVPNEPLKVD